MEVARSFRICRMLLAGPASATVSPGIRPGMRLVRVPGSPPAATRAPPGLRAAGAALATHFGREAHGEADSGNLAWPDPRGKVVGVGGPQAARTESFSRGLLKTGPARGLKKLLYLTVECTVDGRL